MKRLILTMIIATSMNSVTFAGVFPKEGCIASNLVELYQTELISKQIDALREIQTNREESEYERELALDREHELHSKLMGVAHVLCQ